ncbi:MAG TPA: hypothetical protein VNZ01_00535 [Solirubrobacteraceae bacterium]|jgi:hypothetical protein|nr:hypothetical protein [Solirubrobacteraceae bacterium]
MAHVVAFIPDLLFGSRVQADLIVGGHTVDLVGDPNSLGEALSGAGVLVVDLTDEASGRADLLESLSAEGGLDGIRTLAFYSHVEVSVRDRAESAGFDMIVPRSRMAREGAGLVSKLAGGENGASR